MVETDLRTAQVRGCCVISLYSASHRRLFRGALSVAGMQMKRKVFKLGPTYSDAHDYSVYHVDSRPIGKWSVCVFGSFIRHLWPSTQNWNVISSNTPTLTHLIINPPHLNNIHLNLKGWVRRVVGTIWNVSAGDLGSLLRNANSWNPLRLTDPLTR